MADDKHTETMSSPEEGTVRGSYQPTEERGYGVSETETGDGGWAPPQEGTGTVSPTPSGGDQSTSGSSPGSDATE